MPRGMAALLHMCCGTLFPEGLGKVRQQELLGDRFCAGLAAAGE